MIKPRYDNALWVYCAYIEPEWSYDRHRNINGGDRFTVRFNMGPLAARSQFPIYMSVEFADGTTEQRHVEIINDEPLNTGSMCHVESDFELSPMRRGKTYAEIKDSFGPIAAMTFNTSATVQCGDYKGDELKPR